MVALIAEYGGGPYRMAVRVIAKASFVLSAPNLYLTMPSSVAIPNVKTENAHVLTEALIRGLRASESESLRTLPKTVSAPRGRSEPSGRRS